MHVWIPPTLIVMKETASYLDFDDKICTAEWAIPEIPDPPIWVYTKFSISKPRFPYWWTPLEGCRLNLGSNKNSFGPFLFHEMLFLTIPFLTPSENCLATCHDPRRNINLRVILTAQQKIQISKNLAHAPILGVVTNHLFMRAQNYCSWFSLFNLCKSRVIF